MPINRISKQVMITNSAEEDGADHFSKTCPLSSIMVGISIFPIISTDLSLLL